eukprot:4657536-Pleurochrysis_carterae.AAC.3
MQRASDALKVGPPGPFWHLVATDSAAPKDGVYHEIACNIAQLFPIASATAQCMFMIFDGRSLQYYQSSCLCHAQILVLNTSRPKSDVTCLDNETIRKQRNRKSKRHGYGRKGAVLNSRIISQKQRSENTQKVLEV